MHYETMLKHTNEPDEVHIAEKTRLELFRLGDKTIMRGVLEPGWHWAEHVKPLASTESCEVSHVQYVVSGRLHIRLNSGEELSLGPGDFMYVTPGHDAWVEGDEPFVSIDLIAGEEYTKAFQEKEQRKAA